MFRKDIALRDRQKLIDELREHIDAAEKRGKWSRSDDAKSRALEARINEIDEQIRKYDGGELDDAPFTGSQFQTAHARAVRHGLLGDEDDVVLRTNQSMADWVARRHGGGFGVAGGGLDDGDIAEMSLGSIVRAMVTGRRDGMSDAEKRALSEGTDSAGGFLTPELLSARLIDRVRNAGRVFQAGATVVPLDSDTVNLARMTGGAAPGPAWKAEGAAVPVSDMTFDRLQFKPKTLPILVKLSQELFDDMSPGAHALIEGEIAAAIALELDRAALYGSGVAPEPLGIKGQSGVVLTAFGGANGATPTNYDWLLDGIQTLRGANFEPTGFMFAPRTQRTLDGLKDTTNRYLDPPPSYKEIAKFTTNQIRTDLTVGTSAGVCSDVFVGKWDELLVGVRPALGLRVRVLGERFADTLQVGILAWIRADVQLAHAAAFNVISGVKP